MKHTFQLDSQGCESPSREGEKRAKRAKRAVEEGEGVPEGVGRLFYIAEKEQGREEEGEGESEEGVGAGSRDR